MIRILSITLIRCYQAVLAPLGALLGAQCRFYPSCSEYAAQSFGRFPWWHAGWLTLRRLARCHPWHEGGMDPVPE